MTQLFSFPSLLHLNENIVGIDEVGRGCLAGPVFAAALLLKPHTDLSKLKDFKDSKSLSDFRRNALAKKISSQFEYGIGFATAREIEDLNILQASFLAMKRALLKLKIKKAILLIDGKLKIPDLGKNFKQIPILKGDATNTCIAGASILAKVTRDTWMKQLSLKYTCYEFESHKGYPTKKHKDALLRFGPCEEHRSTFSGVKELLTQRNKSSINKKTRHKRKKKPQQATEGHLL